MANILDKNGVTYLWGKIKDKFATKSELTTVEGKIPTGSLASKNTVAESDLTTELKNKINSGGGGSSTVTLTIWSDSDIT